MRNSLLRIATVATGLSIMVIPLAAPSAEASPRLDRQVTINKVAVQKADRLCGKWSPRLSGYRKGCRWGVLKSYGYVPILDRGADGPDANTDEARGLNPYAPPAGDTYAVWGFR